MRFQTLELRIILRHGMLPTVIRFPLLDIDKKTEHLIHFLRLRLEYILSNEVERTYFEKSPKHSTSFHYHCCSDENLKRRIESNRGRNLMRCLVIVLFLKIGDETNKKTRKSEYN